jgi:hypothetical protein
MGLTMKTLIIQANDLTLLADHNQEAARAIAIVDQCANRVLQSDPDMSPAAFNSRLISELVIDSRFVDVFTFARFAIKPGSNADMIEVDSDNLDSKLITRL